MKTYYWTEQTDDSFIEINKFLDEIETTQEKWQIYINSDWWMCRWTDSVLKRLEEIKIITLRVIYAGSSAFDTFYKYTWKKILEPNCYWMAHKDAFSLSVFRKDWINKIRARKSDINYLLYKEKQEYYDYSFFSKEQKEKFNDGEDIFISNMQMKEIFG